MPERSGLFYGKVIHGRIVLQNRDGFASLIARLNGCEIDIELRKHRRVRSLKQNSFYWSVIVSTIADAAGYLPEEAHDSLKQKFLTDHTDEALPRVRSTAGLTTVEFSEYIENCEQFGAEFFQIRWETRWKDVQLLNAGAEVIT